MHRILFGCLSQARHVGHTKGICLWRGDLYSIHGCQMIIEDLLQINRVKLLSFGGNSLDGWKHTANTTKKWCVPGSLGLATSNAPFSQKLDLMQCREDSHISTHLLG